MKKNKIKQCVEKLREQLIALSSAEKAASMRRYFPAGIHCAGVVMSDINSILANFRNSYPELSANDVLNVCEEVLKKAQYSEEVLIGYGLIAPLVKANYDDDLLFRFEYWLENYASNWAHVDDLCIKTVYQFLMARPHLIEQTQPWSVSRVSWCRRASNVVWVKFIRRPMRGSVYYLKKDLVFENCDRLISDPDEFVQKSVGWLLKVTAQHHKKAVIDYIKNNFDSMQRSTIRYALEKVDKETRKKILSAP